MAIESLIHAASGSWRELAMRASASTSRARSVVQAARDYTPEFGDLTRTERSRIVSAVEEILDGVNHPSGSPYIVPLHTSQPYYVPSMLDDGFRWVRPRIDVDGVPFEPYEDKLREYHGLGIGETSEDFLFADVRMVPRTGTVEESLVADAARRRARLGVGSQTSSGFGSVTLAFRPDTLIDTTILPATRLLGQYGSRVGTIEHLPSVIAARIAIEGGARMEVERSGMRLHGIMQSAIDDVTAQRQAWSRPGDAVNGVAA